jgi:hypothetical protein
MDVRLLVGRRERVGFGFELRVTQLAFDSVGTMGEDSLDPFVEKRRVQ